MADTPTLAALLREAAATLHNDSARVDAQVLASHAFGLSHAQLIAFGERIPQAGAVTRFRELVERRAHGEPVAYLIGRREFWSLALEVSSAVLIPRPETELLVELALARIPREHEYVVVDLGTGSGAIALAISRERPLARVHAVDASAAALEVAQRNAQRLNLSNVRFHCGDWLEPVGALRIDMIVSNPPYVRRDDPHLEQGDCRFEPRTALAAGDDGLDAIRRIVGDAPDRLQDDGWLLLEHGYDQGAAVRQLLSTPDYRDVFTVRDLVGHERVTGARRRA